MTERLGRVIWLGGSPCSGKSTVADRISKRFSFPVYDCDDAWFRHGETASPTSHPTLYRLAHANADEIWLRCPVDEQVREAIVSYHELFALVLRELRERPSDTPIIAVGAGLLPELVAGTGVSLDRAVWMVPTEAFQRRHYAEREWRHAILERTSDPGRAWENWMLRDATFASEVTRQVNEVGGQLIVVDGSRDIDAIEDVVLNHSDGYRDP